jgi:hypothetical protein
VWHLEEHISIFRVKRISKLGMTSVVTSNYNMLQRINHYMRKEAIEWDALHDGEEREFLVMVPQ